MQKKRDKLTPKVQKHFIVEFHQFCASYYAKTMLKEPKSSLSYYTMNMLCDIGGIENTLSYYTMNMLCDIRGIENTELIATNLLLL